MKSSTLKRIIRFGVAAFAVVFWQFLAVPVVYFLMTQPVSGYYEPTPAIFQQWELYETEHRSITVAVGMIFWTQLIALIITVVISAVLYGLYCLLHYLWHGSKKVNPTCTDEHCPCNWHGAEVFADGTWDLPECVDPNCTCVNRHADEVFSIKKNKWVNA